MCVRVYAHMTECGQLVGVSSHLLPHGFQESVNSAVNKTDQVRIEELAGWGTGKEQPRLSGFSDAFHWSQDSVT